MPLLFKARLPKSDSDRQWRGLDYSASLGLLVWSGMGFDKPAVAEKTTKPVSYIEDQARMIPLRYHVFAYRNDDLLDRGEGLGLTSFARFLNERGDKPDLSAPTFERGWLMPNGDFVGNLDGNHSDMLHYTLETRGETAKAEGWINIQPDEVLPISTLPPSPAQRQTLKILGFNANGRRSSVPTFTPEFERIRKTYVLLQDSKNAPRLVDNTVATAAILNIEEALRKAADRPMLTGLFATQQLVRHQGEGASYERVKDLVGVGNNLVAREFELLAHNLASVRRLTVS